MLVRYKTGFKMSPLEYKKNSNNELDIFDPILQEHGQWFHDLLECLFYPKEYGNDCDLLKPVFFSQWVASENHGDVIRPEIVQRLNDLHADLFGKALFLCEYVKETGCKPEYKKFKDLITLFEEFIFHVRRVEKDLLVEESGFDPFTSLRNKAMLVGDVSREMERLARQGKSFCLALARIDHFDDIVKVSSEDEVDSYIKLLANLIRISIRSFDDAYYMGNGVFALCLKQADITGGFSALERLRMELENQKISVEFSDSKAKALSMSCCIAEPVVGDDVEQLMKNLSDELAESDMENVDTVLKYKELSALERYVQET